MDDIFGAGFMRLQKVQYAFRPASGPLAQDLSSISMPIVPVGFNDTMELISATTYSKAPEVCVVRLVGWLRFLRERGGLGCEVVQRCSAAYCGRA